MKKEYICVCGKIFTNSQAFNGHKSHCKKHQLQKHGNLTKLINSRNQHNKNIQQTHIEISAKNKQKQQEIKKRELDQWIREKHICERCGKIMTKKFGSGRFCSQSCANSRHHSKETKKKYFKRIKKF